MNLIAIILCLFCSFPVFSAAGTAVASATPRLIITLGPKCDFTHQDLQQQIDAVIVSGTDDEMKEAIRKNERSKSNHLTIFQEKMKDIHAFCKDMGYVYLHLNNRQNWALVRVRRTLATIPLTDADLPRTDPCHAGLFYDMLMKTSRILKQNNIPFWATCGTLLGAIRHQGMIPWDDDIDIAIFEKDVPALLELKDTLESYGLELCFHPRFEFYKICLKDGPRIIDENGETCPWSFPFLDIFPLKEVKGRYTYIGKLWQEWHFDNDYYFQEDLILPLSELPFGPLTIPVPRNSLPYILRMYGEDWNDVAYVTYSHQFEQFQKKIKVDLHDRSPAPYILPGDAIK
ncbi:MAG: LicD family protein [Parachlamydia sp.]|nr:LicD family protein [Parachlamydia sp.]